MTERDFAMRRHPRTPSWSVCSTPSSGASPVRWCALVCWLKTPRQPWLDLQSGSTFEHLATAAVRYRIALGPIAGRKTLTLHDPGAVSSARESTKPLTVARDGFSLNAALACKDHERDKLERLCRYVSRGRIALERLSIDGDGLVVYALKQPFRDGTTHVLFEPLDFIARLAASGSHARAPTWCATMDCSRPMRNIATSLLTTNPRHQRPATASTPVNHCPPAPMTWMQPGSYRFEAYEQRSRIVATNKGKYVAYRGPWANETWVRERMVDVVARELGLSPTAIRRKNMYGAEDFAADTPPTMLTGPALDVTMSVRDTLDRAVELADLEGFERDRAAAAAEGRVLGIGFASYHEAAPGPPGFFEFVAPGTSALIDQPARATVDADGRVRVFTPQMPHGQSHETTYAQIAADELGVGIDDVEIVYGDTSRTPFELLGTGGSRGGPVGGGAVRKTSRTLRRELLEAAAEMLEASVDDIEIVGGNLHVAGVPARGVTFAEVARHRLATHDGSEGAAASGDVAGEVAFEVNERYDGAGDGGWSVATHVCWVDVDLETGVVRIPRYLVVEDCGPVINPAIVDGQVRGGVAQGIGAVLYERVAYDDEASLQSTTYLDYLVPTAMEIPRIEIEHLETLSPGENDFRGVGEGGMIGAPAAITNAIEDALASRGVRITEQYLPPSRILELAGVIEPD